MGHALSARGDGCVRAPAAESRQAAAAAAAKSFSYLHHASASLLTLPSLRSMACSKLICNYFVQTFFLLKKINLKL